jgi:hypothetical protein
MAIGRQVPTACVRARARERYRICVNRATTDVTLLPEGDGLHCSRHLTCGSVCAHLQLLLIIQPTAQLLQAVVAVVSPSNTFQYEFKIAKFLYEAVKVCGARTVGMFWVTGGKRIAFLAVKRFFPVVSLLYLNPG